MTRTKIALDGVLSDSQIFDCEQRLSSMNAVRAKINAETKTVDIEYDETKVSLADICEEISASAGVRVVPPSAAAPQKKKLGTANRHDLFVQRGNTRFEDTFVFRHGHTACGRKPGLRRYG